MSAKKSVFATVRSELDFPGDEARILAFWKEHGIFERTLRAETRATGPSRGSFVFYEGPPTANGMPHNGHVLTRAIKDLLPRYQTMRGYDVPRKAGWDTHGLPVEVEVEKDLGIHGKADIEAYGIKPFIARCLESVFRYTEAWERNTEMIGYWVDLDAAYVTYHRSYVESVWWALSELHKKGLLYRGHKVVWWWAQGGTALSSGEVGQGYKTVDDPSVLVAFPFEGDDKTALLVWTTTPWTLPSNMYAAVNPAFDYAFVTGATERTLVVAKGLVEALSKKLGVELTVVREVKGSELVGQKYLPPFDTFRAEAAGHDVIHSVIAADFVLLDASGMVHIAPAFGEDDYKAHRALVHEGRPSLPLFCAVKPDGTFIDALPEYAGRFVKDCDKDLTADLKRRGLLVHAETYRHEYPFCWRADSDPLIQYARPAWYIRTTAKIDRAIANNRAVRWLPEHIKEGRFGDFLANNVDWALSRERYWGTPLNVWLCDGCGAEAAPASVAEISAKNPAAFEPFERARAADPSLSEHLIVHKPWIDEVTFACDKCSGTMRRVPEVIDCWFDSGCMPFAQWGYPHLPGSKEIFERSFPADFISEAIDQTRGWFYSLLMVSTLLFEDRPFPHPYKSCVVLGHICDREGKKESKKLGNYTPPDVILECVRMEFAPRLGEGKLAATQGTALIAREDYEGLDLAGESFEVQAYRADRPDDRRVLKVKPAKGLPRRIVVLSAEDMAALGLEPIAGDAAVKPSDVPRLPQAQRVFLEDPSRPPPGADAFRWFFYSASPPWTNTRHALSNVRLAQKDFIIKLRNVYSFFCIYADIDRFDPATTGGRRPPAERSLLDRWISSECALAAQDVTARMDELYFYDAAQRLIDLVDALSNWYVRRSRNRFWASASDPALGQDKLDASWTLYEVLVTLTKLIAPFVPFFAEDMYQNLVRGPSPKSAPESVHLCAYPTPDAAAIDRALADDMRAVRELVSLGLSVRTEKALRVRQPLHRADIVVSSAEVVARLSRYEDLVRDELNVHEVRWLLPGQEGEEVSYQLKPNFRALGPRLGKKVQRVKQLLGEADAGALRAELAQTGQVLLDLDGESVALSSAEVEVAVVAAAGFAAAGGRAGVVVLHCALDDQLLDEGLAREVLAKIQAARKQLGLGYTDRIRVALRGSERLCRVVGEHRVHIASEALCDDIALGPVTGDEDAAWDKARAADEDMVLRVQRV